MSLALYWEEIVIPDSVFRWSPVMRQEELGGRPPEWSETASQLEEAGIVRRIESDIPAESLMPRKRPPNEDPDGEMFLCIERGDDNRMRFTGTLRAHLSETVKSVPIPNAEMARRKEAEWREAAASLQADSLIARAQLCQQIAASNNLAPVAPSLLSHIASLTDDLEAPVMEGALIGAAVDAFVVRPDTPVAELVAFRENHRSEIQRFRAAMTDLAEALRQPHVAPEAVLSGARDIYRNRVEGSLGALEDCLSMSRIKFLTRSLFGAAALAVTPMAIPVVADSAVQFGAQTINYRFSREKLLQEHPYGYLHRLSTSDFVIPRRSTGVSLVSPELAPREFVYQHVDALFELMAEISNSQEDATVPPRHAD